MKKKNNGKVVEQNIPAAKEISTPKKITLLLAGICAMIAFLLYANTLSHDYTVDDATVFANNKLTTQGVKAIPEIFTSAYRKGFWDRNESLYRPLSVAMFALEWQIAPNNPHLSHWINVLLYSLTAFLLFLLLQSLFGEHKIYLAFFVTLLFVCHPIHTEVIANNKSRDEIVSLLCAVISFYFLLKSFDRKKITYYFLCSFFFLLALLSKESALTLTAIAPITLYFFRKATLKNALTYSLPVFFCSIVYLLIRFSVLGGVSNFTEIQPINNSLVTTSDFLIQKATALFILGKYNLLLLFPHPLSFDYSFNQIPNKSFADAGVLITAALLIYLLFFSIKNFKSRSIISYGVLFFLITISLTSNIFFLIESIMAERFLYLPSLGFCIGIILLLTKFLKFDKNLKQINSASGLFAYNKSLSALLLFVCLLFSIKTISRNNDWKNNITLLETDIKTSPNSARIRYAYGSALLIEQALKEKDESRKQMLLSKSIEQLEKGVTILSTYADAYYHLGLAYKEKKDFANAVKNFELAMQHKNFNDAEFFIAAGVSYGMNKQYEKSIATLKKALIVKPENAEAYNNMGVYYDEWQKPDSSIIALQKAIQLDQKSPSAYYNMGNTYAHIGKFIEAIDFYKHSLAIDSTNVDAINNIGNSYASQKDFGNALTYFLKALEKDSSNAKAINNVGVTYMMIGDKAKGDYYLQKLQQQ